MSKNFAANGKRLIIFIYSFAVLLISSLIYIIDEDLLKFLFSGRSATYDVQMVYNNVILVFSFAILLIIFAFLSINKKWTKYILIVSFACWVSSLRTYAVIKDERTIVVHGISIFPVFKTEIEDFENISTGKFDFIQRKKLQIAIKE